LQFKKETIKNYRNSDLDISIERCQHYILSDNRKIVGHFYCGSDNSIGVLNDTYLVINKLRTYSFNRQYEVRNVHNNAIVGDIAISDFTFSKSLQVSLDIIHQEAYTWKVMESVSEWSIFSVFSRFYGRLFNETEDIVIHWNYKSEQPYKHRRDEIPIEGDLQMTNPSNHFLLFAGLFLAERQFQRYPVD